MPISEQSYPLTDIKGKEYLEVKYRIDWLRKDHPDADITTTIHSMDSTHAVVTCRVSIPNGGSATGSAMEEVGRFPFLEKAETSAIGRALGALGYGTLQCMDFDEEPTRENAKLADSPVQRQQSRQPAQPMAQAAAMPARESQRAEPPITPPQKNLIYGLGRTLYGNEETANERCEQYAGCDIEHLTLPQAKEFIDLLKNTPVPEAKAGDPLADDLGPRRAVGAVMKRLGLTEQAFKQRMKIDPREKISEWGARLGWDKAQAEAEGYESFLKENPGAEGDAAVFE
jgi:hypothetical protein